MSAGPDAAHPDCAVILASLTDADTLGGLPRRPVDAQSVAAWGDPAITLRCGVAPPEPTANRACLRVDDIDWIGPSNPAEDDRTYVSYGRTPAVEVFVPLGSDAAIETVLVELASVVAQIDQARECS